MRAPLNSPINRLLPKKILFYQALQPILPYQKGRDATRPSVQSTEKSGLSFLFLRDIILVACMP